MLKFPQSRSKDEDKSCPIVFDGEDLEMDAAWKARNEFYPPKFEMRKTRRGPVATVSIIRTSGVNRERKA
jgi:hypothetical protein